MRRKSRATTGGRPYKGASYNREDSIKPEKFKALTGDLIKIAHTIGREI
jgi:hypothetical protein